MNTQPTSNTKDTEAVNPVQRRSERTRGGRGSGRKPLARTDGQDTPGTSAIPTDGTPAEPADEAGKPTLPPLPPTPPRTAGRRPDGEQTLTPSVAPKDAKQSRIGRSPASHLAQKAGENLQKTPGDVKAVVEARKGGADKGRAKTATDSKEMTLVAASGSDASGDDAAAVGKAGSVSQADAKQDGEDEEKTAGRKADDKAKMEKRDEKQGGASEDWKAEEFNGKDDESTQNDEREDDDAEDEGRRGKVTGN